MHKNYIRYKAKTKELIYDLKYLTYFFLKILILKCTKSLSQLYRNVEAFELSNLILSF